MKIINACNYKTTFELVKTIKQQKEFEKTWEFFCAKYGWYNDPYAKNGVRYNLIIKENSGWKRKKVIGTIEFIPYDPNNPNSTVEGPNKFEFSKFPEIHLHQERVWEVDKLCIHEAYQGSGIFQLFMHIFNDHALLYKPKYYVALIEKKFYRMLRISYGLLVEQKGVALNGPTTALIPMMFDVERVMQDENKMMCLLTEQVLANEIKKINNVKRQSFMAYLYQLKIMRILKLILFLR